MLNTLNDLAVTVVFVGLISYLGHTEHADDDEQAGKHSK